MSSGVKNCAGVSFMFVQLLNNPEVDIGMKNYGYRKWKKFHTISSIISPLLKHRCTLEICDL